MKLIKTLVHNDLADLNGRAIMREAVRGIILDQQKLLMVYSQKNRDYKFPGGGIRTGESQQAALRREIQEEIGMQVIAITGSFGKMIEYDIPIEPEYDVFKMTSYYYWCEVSSQKGKQHLDHYEKALGYKPIWIEIDKAIRKNHALLQNSGIQKPRWIKRELEVLKQIKMEMMDR